MNHEQKKTQVQKFLKLGAILLLVSFCISPISVLANQEAPLQENSPQQESSSSNSHETGQSPESKKPQNESAPEESLNSENLEMSEGLESSSLVTEQNAQSGPAGAGKGGVADPASGMNAGALIYDFVFEVPPGRSGQTPDLKLNYSSRNSDDTGFGYGWDISIPYIERQNKTGFGTMYSTSTPGSFYSSLSGELVNIPSTSTYLSRNDDGSNLQYTFSSNTWTVKDKNGNVYEFGLASSTRQDDISGSGKVFKWMLQKLTDANGNVISYSYTKDLGQIYPASVTYTDTATTTGIFRVDFSLGLQATSSATSTTIGFPVKTRYQVNQVFVITNGTTTKSYALTYGVGDNGNRTVLKNIVETGQSSTGSLSLPATIFQYSTSSTAFATSTTGDPAPLLGNYMSGGVDTDVITIDVNGDGLLDAVQSYDIRDAPNSNLVTRRVISMRTITNSWEDSASYILQCPFSWSPSYVGLSNGKQDGGGRLVDVNGDGLPDLICESSTYLNNGTNWVASTTWNTPLSMIVTDGGGNSIDSGSRFADINGDGLLDIIRGFTLSGSYTSAVYINNGQGWTIDSSWVLPYHLDFSVDSNDGGGRLIDVNGDGLADIFYGIDDSGVATSSVYINNGTGWTTDSSWILPDGAQAHAASLLFLDINSDHLVDFSIATGTLASSTDVSSFSWNDNRVYLNTGSGWKRDLTRSVPFAYTIHVPSVGPLHYPTGVRVGNIDGNGLIDFQVSAAVWAVKYTGEQFATGEVPDLLKHVTESAGRKISVTYRSTSDYQIYYDNGSTINSLAYYFPIVHRLTYDNGISSPTAETFEYSEGKFYYGSATDRRFGGFGKVIKSDSAFNKSIFYYHIGGSTASTTGQHADNQAKIGKLYRMENYGISTTTLYRVLINKWESFARGASNFVFPTRTTVLSYDKQVTHKDSSQEFVYSTTTGDLLEQISWGEVTAANDGSFTDIGTDKFIKQFSYAASSTSPLTKNSQITTLDQSLNTVAGTKYFYDSLGTGAISRGNLTEQNDLKSGTSTYVKTLRTTFNSFGLPVQQLDPRGATTTLSYDSYNLYPATTTNALGHVNTALYNYSLGLPSVVTDPNGATIKTLFDPLNRVVAILKPDPSTPSILATTTTYTYLDTGFPRRIQQTNYLSASQSVTKYTYIDGVGREVQTRTQAEASNTYKVKEVTYNGLGLVSAETYPVFGTGIGFTGTSSPGTINTVYEYDPLQRMVRMANNVGSTTNTYVHWKETIVDPNGKKKEFYKDAFGLLSKVVEFVGTSTATTTYAYDGNGKLTQLTDALGNIRNFTYNKLGQLLTSEDLHASGDTTFGTSTYAYDDVGNLTQTVTPLSKIISYSYDALNRILTEDSNDTGYVDIRYTYDTSVHAGVGRLSTVSTAYVGTAYDYDMNGNLSAERHLIPGSATTTTYYYFDRQQNPTYVIYPDGANAYYGYNNAGLVDFVLEIESGAPSWTTLVSNYDYSPLDQITTTQYGNSTVSVNTYSAIQNYRLSTKVAYNSSIYFQYLAYSYDAVGNPTVIQNAASTNAARIMYYTYDDLHRLTVASSTNASSGSNYRQTFSYGLTGNLISNSGTNYLYQGDSGSNYANPHAATSIGGTTNTYDKQGHLLSDGRLSNTWNYRGELTQAVATIGTTTATSTYTYNQNGDRISATTGALTTYYPNKYFTITSAGTKEKYVYGNGQLLATVQTVGTTTKILYSYLDHLGSTHVVANASGTPVEILDYYPYGSLRLDLASTSFKTQRKYVGEYYDAETLLSYLNARYYDGSRGQFISQDTVFQNLNTDPRTAQALLDPQQLNAYSYARNNPVFYKDAGGESPIHAAGYGALLIGELYSANVLLNAVHNYANTQNSPNNYSPGERNAAWQELAGNLAQSLIASRLNDLESAALTAGGIIFDGVVYAREYFSGKSTKKNRSTENTSVAGISKPSQSGSGSTVNKTETTKTTSSSNKASSNSPSSAQKKELKNIQKQINNIQKQIDKLKKQQSQKNKK